MEWQVIVKLNDGGEDMIFRCPEAKSLVEAMTKFALFQVLKNLVDPPAVEFRRVFSASSMN